MNRICLVLILVSLAAISCRAPAPDAQQVTEPVPEAEKASAPVSETTPPAEDAMQMKGIDLYMHRRMPQDGVPGKPELWVKADSFSIEDSQTYVFENAHAVIYGRDEEEIRLEAQRGWFEQDKSAQLEGAVRLAAGTLKMFLQDIQWHRSEEAGGGVVQSDNPVIIDDPDLQLNAAGLLLYPDTSVFELTDVSGVVRFGKELL